jgi:hypothetical protein
MCDKYTELSPSMSSVAATCSRSCVVMECTSDLLAMTALSYIAYVVLNRNIHRSMYVEISNCAGNGQWYIFRFL